MVGDNGYYDPVGYHPMWLWIACGIVALVLLWYIAVWFYPRARAPQRRPVVKRAPEEIVPHYLRLIDEIESANASGELSLREAHLKLSVLVRLFGEERSGTSFSTMTLSDLTEGNHAHIAHAVASYYPFEFGTAPSGDLAPSLQRAREVVR
ncbi:hypothetical protein [Paramicrobacterium agarici]|uniref:hypothetical protein n=1 Tax=Paramicrobacterium agarici TaxID=630514 RepID=UPI001151DA3C|nr:hypothetical protein [Microbacterium agarici]TQO24031.1 hypothetical protein FB385_2901 [Microbacterium agarici]